MSFLGKITGSAEQDSASGIDVALSLTRDEYRPGTEATVYGGVLAQEVVAEVRRSCASPDCVSSWSMPWRNRRRPVFEGLWGCSGRCMLAIVRGTLRREQGERRGAQPAEPHRHRVPLGLVMLAQGWITQPQLQKALAQQRASGSGRIGDWLISECGLETEQVTRGLSVQWGCPVLSLDGFSPSEMALVMPKVFLEEFGLVPAAQLQTARARLLECDAAPTSIEQAEDEDALAARITAILEQRKPAGSRLVRAHQYYWLRLWLERGANGRNGNLPAGREDMYDYVFTIAAAG
jgi:hypothetical protein